MTNALYHTLPPSANYELDLNPGRYEAMIFYAALLPPELAKYARGLVGEA